MILDNNNKISFLFKVAIIINFRFLLPLNHNSGGTTFISSFIKMDFYFNTLRCIFYIVGSFCCCFCEKWLFLNIKREAINDYLLIDDNPMSLLYIFSNLFNQKQLISNKFIYFYLWMKAISRIKNSFLRICWANFVFYYENIG